MNEKDRLFGVLNLEKVDRVPCVSPLQTGTIDLMKASGAFWPEANNNPFLMAKLAKAGHTVAGLEGVRLPFDVSVDATAFGALTGKENIERQPAILKAPVCTQEQLEAAVVPDPHSAGRAPVVLDALRTLAKDPELAESPLICAIVGPFMLTGQLRGSQDAIMDVALNPRFIKGILEKATQWDIAFAQAALREGADVIAIIDATSSGDVLGPSQYAEFAMPYHKRLVEAILRADGYSILHICGKTTKNMPYMIETKANGISVDQQMDIGWVKQQVKGKAACIGNVSPTSTLLYKKPSDVEAETKRVIEAGTNIVAPGCGFAPETPLANMRAMVEATLKYGKIP
ncbi:MAG: MtaA/CmuA family methyltransferase [Methanomassiliicoccales archaeon]|nr:MtaA/CmuA family methyltransferase [Methanomassiliicoccales archaeon]